VSNINMSVRTSFSGLYDDGRRVCYSIGAEGTLCKKYETARHAFMVRMAR
jgi:hypothetical protein